MKIVSVSTLKARLSEFLSAVTQGEEVLITDRGAPVARLVPLSPTQELGVRLEELFRAGVARAPTRPLPDEFWSLTRPPDPKGSVRKALEAERREGR